MYKVVVDGFDSEEEIIAFTDWLYKNMNAGRVQILTTEGLKFVSQDGVDYTLCTKYQKHLDITTWKAEPDDDL